MSIILKGDFSKIAIIIALVFIIVFRHLYKTFFIVSSPFILFGLLKFLKALIGIFIIIFIVFKKVIKKIAILIIRIASSISHIALIK